MWEEGHSKHPGQYGGTSANFLQEVTYKLAILASQRKSAPYPGRDMV